MKNIITLLIALGFFSKSFCQWQVTSGPSSPNVNSIAVSNSGVFASTSGPIGSGGGVSISSNSGSNWSIINNGLSGYTWKLITNGNNIYCASTGTVFQSSNNGVNWSNTGSGLSTYDVRSIFCSANGDLYAGSNGLYKSTNNGILWSSINVGWSNIVLSVIVNGNLILAGTLSSNLYKSTDGGQSWTHITSSLPSQIDALGIVGTTYLAGTPSGIYYSTNAGQTWSISNINSSISSFHTVGTNIFAGGSNGMGVYQSTTNGTNWYQINTGLSNLNVYSLNSDNNFLYCGTQGYVWKRSLSEIIVCNPTYSNQNVNSCQFYLSPSGNQTWTTSGNYSDTILNLAGCDSIIFIGLTIINVDTSVSQNGSTLVSNASNSTYQWVDCTIDAQISGATLQSYSPNNNGSFCVIVSQAGCTDTSSCYSVTDVGLNEINLDFKLEISPNPVHDKLYINNIHSDQWVTFEIYNSMGMLVSRQTGFVNNPIEIPELANGLYFLRIDRHSNFPFLVQ